MIRIGTAGWSIPKAHAADCPGAGSQLARYARILSAVEINSSFYRPHRPTTYERWAASVPHGFRFAVKVPREITHSRKLVASAPSLDQFLSEVRRLGDALGPLLVQLPPSLVFVASTAETFFGLLRDRFDGYVVCEPRHPTWFTDDVEALLARHQIARVAADPAPVARAAWPGGWTGLVYRRLHGSPHMYYSGYSADDLARIAATMRDPAASGGESWCIFDNTALGEAMHDALALSRSLQINPAVDGC